MHQSISSKGVLDRDGVALCSGLFIEISTLRGHQYMLWIVLSAFIY